MKRGGCFLARSCVCCSHAFTGLYSDPIKRTLKGPSLKSVVLRFNCVTENSLEMGLTYQSHHFFIGRTGNNLDLEAGRNICQIA